MNVLNIKVGNITIPFNSLNSLTFSRNIKLLLSVIEDEIYKPINRIASCLFLCGIKLQMYYKLPFDKHDIVIKNMTKVVLNNNIPETCKILHTKFVYDNINYEISKNIYNEIKNNNFVLSIEYYIILLKEILRLSKDEELINSIYNNLETMYNNENDLYYKMKIADIFYMSKDKRKRELGEQMLEHIRYLEEIIRNREENLNKKCIKTIYSDSQNVHNTTINKNVKKVGQQLIYKMNVFEFDTKLVLMEIKKYILKNYEKYTKKYSNLKDFHYHSETYEDELIDIVENFEFQPLLDLICKTLNRFQYDTSIFDTFTLCQLFSSIWKFIQTNVHKEELMDRLIEEIVEMHKYCTTGHLSRLVNVIQGFTDDEDLQIKISSLEQIKSVIYVYLSKKMENAPDEIIDNMTEEDNNKFLNYICDIINKNLNNFISEYGEEVIKYLLDIVQNYTNSKNIKLNEKNNLYV